MIFSLWISYFPGFSLFGFSQGSSRIVLSNTSKTQHQNPQERDGLLPSCITTGIYHWSLSHGLPFPEFPMCYYLSYYSRPRGSFALRGDKGFLYTFSCLSCFFFLRYPRAVERTRTTREKRRGRDGSASICAFPSFVFMITHCAAQAQQQTNENTSGPINVRHIRAMEDKSWGSEDLIPLFFSFV